MEKIKIYQIDAFAEKLFTGNPAAVCVMDNWPEDVLLHAIAAENNLAETAFIIPENGNYAIRWFTPTIEVDLCGHATLAAAYVVFNFLGYTRGTISFRSLRSGNLNVSKQDDYFLLDFPTDLLLECDITPDFKKCIGIDPIEARKGKSDYLVMLESEEDVINVIPDFIEIAKLNCRGLIVTAKGNKVDFVSRFFAPQSGVNEDPVTGSAHTSLIPFWSSKLLKKNMNANQLSKRGGELICKYNGNRCVIGGKAKLYMTGEIWMDLG